MHSYVKYETNGAAKRKALWSQKLDLYLRNGRLRDKKWRVFDSCKQSSFTLVRRVK